MFKSTVKSYPLRTDLSYRKASLFQIQNILLFIENIYPLYDKIQMNYPTEIFDMLRFFW